VAPHLCATQILQPFPQLLALFAAISLTGFPLDARFHVTTMGSRERKSAGRIVIFQSAVEVSRGFLNNSQVIQGNGFAGCRARACRRRTAASRFRPRDRSSIASTFIWFTCMGASFKLLRAYVIGFSLQVVHITNIN